MKEQEKVQEIIIFNPKNLSGFVDIDGNKCYYVEIGCNKDLVFYYKLISNSEEYVINKDGTKSTVQPSINYIAARIQQTGLKWMEWEDYDENNNKKEYPQLNVGKKYLHNHNAKFSLNSAYCLYNKYWIECFSLSPKGNTGANPRGILLIPKADRATITRIAFGFEDFENSNVSTRLDEKTYNKAKDKNNSAFKYGEVINVYIQACNCKPNPAMVVKVRKYNRKTKSIDLRDDDILDMFKCNLSLEREHGQTIVYSNRREKDVLKVQIKSEWKEKVKHKKGDQVPYVLEIDFVDEKVMADGYSKTVGYSAIILVEYNEDDEAIDSRQSLNANMVMIGEEAGKAKGIEPCRYKAITIKTGKDKNGVFQNKFDCLFEKVEMVYDFTHLPIQLVAGSGKGAKEVQIVLDELKLLGDSNTDGSKIKCLLTPAHIPGSKQPYANFDLAKVQAQIPENITAQNSQKKEDSYKVDVTINGVNHQHETGENNGLIFELINDNRPQLTFNAQYQYEENLHLISFEDLYHNYLFFQKLKSYAFDIGVQTCRYNKLLHFNVFPDLKWIFNLSFNFDDLDFQKNIAYQQAKYTLANMGNSYEFEQDDPTLKDESEKSLKSKVFKSLALAKKGTGNVDLSVNSDTRKLPAKPSKDKLMDVINAFKVSLKGEWNAGDDSEEYSEKFIKYQLEPYKKLFLVMDKVKEIVKAKHNAPLQSYKEDNEVNDTNIAKLKQAIVPRKLFELNWVYPSIGISAAWYLDDNSYTAIPGQAFTAQPYLDINVKLDPLIGVSLKLDFLALIQNRHPLAFLVIKIMDIGAALGFAPRVTAELVAEGTISITGHDLIQLQSGKHSFTDNKMNARAKQVRLECLSKVEVTVNLSLKYKFEIKVWVYSIVATGEVSASAKTYFALQLQVSSDYYGTFLQPTLVFGGLNITIVVNAKLESETKDSPDFEAEINVVNKTYTVLKDDSTNLEKIYLTNTFTNK